MIVIIIVPLHGVFSLHVVSTNKVGLECEV
jgi:hypothetical protein